ncbi:hypothetical protein AMTRI_Chr06g176250 [Amborella trichopoda]|uniref:Uncharacterized protein n=1 Tax=Amborella trichopoda TaxID=13333 RepID=U5CZA3_AMBTC|nr:uncharacterized protein LOC18442759 [Amborella trichopoda]ERN14467.1 hypothetical protein AMTR_s00174p00016680 [Amborella trichopoda]|eukprot:XP_020528228.1 uncharacterized protein LOC18442759 [Amborella trichopoda]
MPKPICSPDRRHDRATHHHLSAPTRAHGSLMLRAKVRAHPSPVIELHEPTSPKVTCAGQVRVKPRRACKTWQSAMEEIEKLHANKHRGNSGRPIGSKFAEAVHFLTALTKFRFHFRCFGGFPSSYSSSDEEEEEEEEEEREAEGGGAGTVFAKWFMILQEDPDKKTHLNGMREKVGLERERGFVGGEREKGKFGEEREEEAPTVPPPNALLLMRCRSAALKGWEEEEKVELKTERGGERKHGFDCFRVSPEISRETWVKKSDYLSGSRSWKR